MWHARARCQADGRRASNRHCFLCESADYRSGRYSVLLLQVVRLPPELVCMRYSNNFWCDFKQHRGALELLELGLPL